MFFFLSFPQYDHNRPETRADNQGTMLLQTFSKLVGAALWEKLQDFTALSSFTNKHQPTECLTVCRCGHTCFSQTASGCFCFKQTCVSLWVHVQTEVCTLEWWSSLWMCVRISELFGMAPFVSLSFLCLLLSDLELVYGGIICFIFSIIILHFSLTGGSFQLCSLTSTVLTAWGMVDRPQRLNLFVWPMRPSQLFKLIWTCLHLTFCSLQLRLQPQLRCSCPVRQPTASCGDTNATTPGYLRRCWRAT